MVAVALKVMEKKDLSPPGEWQSMSPAAAVLGASRSHRQALVLLNLRFIVLG